jgi:hypothetical protein
MAKMRYGVWFSLIVFLGATPIVSGQQVPSAPPAASSSGQSGGSSVRSLKIVALEGQNAVNSIPAGGAVAPVIEVRDQNDLPVEGARVAFEAPKSGPGAKFEGGATEYVAITDGRGQAMGRGYQINNLAGTFTIRITATLRDVNAFFSMSQVNSTRPETSAAPQAKSSKKWVWVTVGLAAAGGGGFALYWFGFRDSRLRITATAGPGVFGLPQ